MNKYFDKSPRLLFLLFVCIFVGIVYTCQSAQYVFSK